MRKEKNPLELWNDNFMSVWLHERPDVVLIQIRYDKIWQTLTSFTLYHTCDFVDQRHNLRERNEKLRLCWKPSWSTERQKHLFPEDWRNFALEWLLLSIVLLPLLTIKGELSTWELERLQREWSAGLSRSSHRAHWEAGFLPLFVFGEPSREQASGASEGRVSPQFVSQDETTGQWIKLVYFIGTGLLSRRFM